MRIGNRSFKSERLRNRNPQIMELIYHVLMRQRIIKKFHHAQSSDLIKLWFT